jgi:hypothetical protein
MRKAVSRHRHMVICSRYPFAVVVFLLVLGGTARPGAAQQSDTVRKTLRATTRSGPIHVDGRLSEPDWARADVAKDFVQREPEPNEPESQRTEVRVLVDDGALYVGARLFDSDARRIAAQLGRRDPDELYTDAFHVAIDSYFDRRTAFRFSVTPAGVQADALHFNDSNDDDNWDAVYESAATIDSAGWTAELRIPLSQLRYGRLRPGEARRWGIQFAREIARLGEESMWSPAPPTQPGIVSRFGDLVGIDSLGVPRRLELLPYVSSKLTRVPSAEANALVEATRTAAHAGLDVRYGLPRGLTLTATINPDFGQVEVDPAVVNLSAFETFFAERRPFFLEGSEIFRFGGTVTYNDADPPQPFYSRRIGRAPRGSVEADNAVFVDEPSQTNILGAVKVSGKTPDGWSLGFLGAATDRMRARYMTDAGVVATSPVEPRANYGVARVSRDLRGGNTVIGLAFTGAQRDVSQQFAPILASSAVTAGLSGEHAWDNRRWTLSGYASRSNVDGDPAFIAALQRSNTHAYQRPDRKDVKFDSSRSALGGHFYSLSMAKTGGEHWLGSLTYEEAGAGYDVNELGFQRRSDIRALGSALQYRQTSPGRLFRNWSFVLHNTESRNADGDNIERRATIVGEAQWNNFWSTQLIGRVQPATFDDRLTRGGPVGRRSAAADFELSIQTDDRRPVDVDVEYSYSQNSTSGWGHNFAIELFMRPSSALQLSIEPNFSRQYNDFQFVTAVSDPLAQRTFGRRYVFGDIEQHELSIDMRVAWTFSPKLSLQMFAQPFVSAGRFDRYKEFRTPRTYEFDVYGRDRGTIVRNRQSHEVTVDPDGVGPAPAFQFEEPEFTVRALRGNAVLRWEYRPGSTLYFVWQQNREDELAVADLAAARRPADAFRVAAHNVFLIKASYWLGQ